MRPEQAIQSKIIDYLKQAGAFTVKVVVATKAGVPDLLVCYQGTFIGIEVKAPGGRATQLQLAKGRAIARAGGVFSVVTGIKDVKQIIQGIDERLQHKSKGEHNGG